MLALLLVLLALPTDTLSAAEPQWSASADVRVEAFAGDRAAWDEQSVTVGHHRAGTALLGSVARVSRFGEATPALTLDGYATLVPRTYANVRLRWAEDARVMPRWDALAEIYHGVGAGIEVSAGYRALAGPGYRVDVIQGSASWTDDTWGASLRASVAPGREAGAVGVSGAVRRFFDAPGPFASFAELRAGREREVTPLDGVAEAVVFEAWSVALRGQAPVAGRIGVRGGIGHVSGAPLTRWTGDLGLFVRF